jgi:hypothetical protein
MQHNGRSLLNARLEAQTHIAPQAPKTKKERVMTKYFKLMDRLFAGALLVTGVWYVGAIAQMI